jgi:thymidylate synthase
MNKLDLQYQSLLQDILENGVEKKDRTGTGTLSIFGRQIRHKMIDGFPMLTTKKMYFKGIVTELLWFLRGDTNIKFLIDNDCHIWNGDAIKNYERQTGPIDWGPYITKEEAFVEAMKDEEFAKKWGELGPIYGKQWRNWNSPNISEYQHSGWNSIDQIQNLFDALKKDPDSRRLMVTAWNPGELENMVLPPCHYGFQVFTRELSYTERYRLWFHKNYETGMEYNLQNIPDFENPYYSPTPKRAISLMWNQRSVDTFLGLPFNIASYGLLLEIIAHISNTVPEELIGNLGDTHLYLNHIEQAKEQIGRKYGAVEREEMLKAAMGKENWEREVADLMPFGGGMSEFYDIYQIPRKTREPYDLPRLRINSEFWLTKSGECGTGPFTESVGALMESMSVEDFQIENYKSHPAIKAPLSN